MSTVTVCNGCNVPLVGFWDGVTGRRSDRCGGAGLPAYSDGDFHWCLPCATVAFHAVAMRQAPPDSRERHELATQILDRPRATGASPEADTARRAAPLSSADPVAERPT